MTEPVATVRPLLSPTVARLLDATVDEVIFGRAWKTSEPVSEGVLPTFVPTIVNHLFSRAPRHFTSDIADAWLVVRALRAEGWLFEIDTYDESDEWRVVIVAEAAEDLTAGSAVHGCFELAVCLAALRLKQLGVEHV
jgi:hypothetical protein